MKKKAMMLGVLGIFIGFGMATQSVHADTNIYRLYNPNAKGQNHFWSSSLGEDQSLVRVGWNDEGVKWVEASSGNRPIYRLYTGTEHYYTTSLYEKNWDIQHGWHDEGIMGYSSGAVPVYDMYKQGAGHFFTTNTNELSALSRMGYGSKKIAFYVKAVEPTGVLYQTQIRTKGWSAWMNNSEISGTTGKALLLGYPIFRRDVNTVRTTIITMS
jgi:hypothetical protein